MKHDRFYGKVKQKQLLFSPENLPRWVKTLERIESNGGDFELEIKERQEPTSKDQHGYYRGGIIREAQQTNKFAGWEEDDVHDFFAGMFLKFTFHRMLNGHVVEVSRTRSTSSLSKKEMAEFIEKVIAWLAQEGITVGSPEDYYYKRNQTR